MVPSKDRYDDSSDDSTSSSIERESKILCFIINYMYKDQGSRHHH